MEESPRNRSLSVLFGRAPVSLEVYRKVGFGLVAAKYLVEAITVSLLTGKFFSPWMFLIPSLEDRRELLGEDAATLSIVWAVWTLPFVWIAFSMTVRRALAVRHSPWWGVLIFVPIANVFAMLVFAMLRGRTQEADEESPEPRSLLWRSSEHSDPRFEDGESPPPNVFKATIAVMLCLTIAGAMFAVGVLGAGEYGASLFFGTPVVMGMTIAVFTHRPGVSDSRHLKYATLVPVCFSGLLLLSGLEGIICIFMMLPMAIPLSLIGAVLGRAICEKTAYPRKQTGLAILALPLWLGAEVAWDREQPTLSVTTSIEIAAPIDKVWENVIRFPDLEPPEEWMFRLGIACPMKARIDGEGVGAVRHCIFTTGTFVEPITVWAPPNHLAFDVTKQPPPMFELSPYHDIHPPHLDGSLRSERGEFRLERLSGGRTRLTGTTWYQLDIHPRQYWALWSDWLIQSIHSRVLTHIKRCSER